MIVPNKHLSQKRTLKPHINLHNNHHFGRVSTLQRLRSTILLPQLIRKIDLVNLVPANTTYALILTLITQTYTDIDLCKMLFQPLLCAILILFFFLSSAHTSFRLQSAWSHEWFSLCLVCYFKVTKKWPTCRDEWQKLYVISTALYLTAP